MADRDVIQALRAIKALALQHHGDEPPSELLHALLVEIPAECDSAIAALDAADARPVCRNCGHIDRLHDATPVNARRCNEPRCSCEDWADARPVCRGACGGDSSTPCSTGCAERDDDARPTPPAPAPANETCPTCGSEDRAERFSVDERGEVRDPFLGNPGFTQPCDDEWHATPPAPAPAEDRDIWQHDETGRIVELPAGSPSPGKRYFRVRGMGGRVSVVGEGDEARVVFTPDARPTPPAPVGSRCAKCGEPTDPWLDGDGGDERCRCTPTPPAPADDKCWKCGGGVEQVGLTGDEGNDDG